MDIEKTHRNFHKDVVDEKEKEKEDTNIKKSDSKLEVDTLICATQEHSLTINYTK